MRTSFGRLEHRWEDIIKMEREDVVWIHLAQNRTDGEL